MTSKKAFGNLDEIFSYIFMRRRLAASSPQKEVSVPQKSPKEVIASIASRVAHCLAKDDFIFVEKKPSCEKNLGAFSFVINFRPERFNAVGKYSALSVVATVESSHVKKWRKSNWKGINHGVVTGGNLGNLQEPGQYIIWDWDEHSELEGIAEDIYTTTKEIALPYFELFENEATLSDQLISTDIPNLSIGAAIELLACHVSLESAKSAAQQWLVRHGSLIPAFRAEFSRLSPTELSSRELYGEGAKQCAFYCRYLNFGDLSETINSE